MDSSNTTHGSLPFYQVFIYSFLTTVLSLCTFCGNLMVLISVGIEVHLRSISNYYIVSLAIADFLIGAISMPLYSTFLITTYWPFSGTICDLWLSLDYTVSNASVANLLIISYDRYKTITCPLTYRVRRSKRKTMIIIIIAWIISALIWTPLIYIWPVIQGGRTVPSDQCFIQFIGSSQFITLITVCIAYFIPLIIIMSFSFQIYLVTRRRNKSLMTLGCNIMATVGRPMSLNTTSNDAVNHTESSNVKSDTDTSTQDTLTIKTKKDSVDTNGIVLTPALLSSNASNINDGYIGSFRKKAPKNKLRKSIKTKKVSNKAVKTLAAIIIAFFVTWFPYNIFTVINTFKGPNNTQIIGETLYSLGYYLCYINSTINPILYACCNIRFRKTFWRILTLDRCSKDSKVFSCMPTNLSSTAAH